MVENERQKRVKSIFRALAEGDAPEQNSSSEEEEEEEEELAPAEDEEGATDPTLVTGIAQSKGKIRRPVV